MTTKSATTSKNPQTNEGEIEQSVNDFDPHKKGIESLVTTKCFKYFVAVMIRTLFAKNTITVFNLQEAWHFLDTLPTMSQG